MRIAVTHDIAGDDAAVRAAIETCIDASFRLNCQYLRHNPNTPFLYQSGVRYRKEPRGCDDTICKEERFAGIAEVLERGWGDCDDLAPWRAAELTVRFGIPSRPIVAKMAPRLWHVIVQRDSDHALEDPSKLLGMR